MKMNRRDFFPTAYLAAVAGAKLAAGKASPAEAAGRFHFDSQARRYSITGPVGVKEARMGVEIDGVTHWADEAKHVDWSGGETGEAKIEFTSPTVTWRVRFAWETDGHALVVSSTLENHGKQPLKLGRCQLIDTTGPASAVLFGEHPENATAMVTNGTGFPWRTHGLAPSTQRRAERTDTFSTEGVNTSHGKLALVPGQSVSAKGPFISKTLTQWFTPAGGPALQFGFLTFDRAETVTDSGWDEARHVPVVRAWTDFQGTELQPGASLDSETFRIGLETNPHAALEAWGDAVYQRYHPPLWQNIPGGWLGGSWVDDLNTELYEDAVHRNIRAVRNRLKLDETHLQYVWVSIGNLKDMLPGNWLNWNYEHFPAGPEALVEDLGSLKFTLGFWTGMFWLSAQIPGEVEELRDAMLKYQGKPIVINHRDLGPMYVPDPTHPKTQAFIHKVYTTYRKWGVRYYMTDFIDAIAGATPGTHPNDGYFDKTKITGPQAWREGFRAIREAAGDDTYLLGSTSPTLQMVGCVNGQRVGSDYGEGRSLYGPGKGFYPGTFVINKPDYWTSHRTGLCAMMYYFTHRKLFLADSGNVMTVDKPVPLADAQITATIFGINGGPVMLGDDIDRMDEDRLQMVRTIFPRLPECARPIDLFDYTEIDYPQVFHLKVEREWDNWDLLAVFNLGEHTLFKTVSLERLGLDPKAAYAVFDFWNQRFEGIETRGAVSVEVPPDSVKLLRIARDHEHPWILSTDMHVRQGQAEILDCKWDEDAMTLTLRAQRPAGHEGSIYAHAPKGWALAEPKGLWLARDGRDNSLVIRKSLKFEGEPVEVKMHFKRFTG
jgi:hypothetical protein